ncbi:HigA family addiction module antitoxin [Roseobacteraceae bacterium S113]
MTETTHSPDITVMDFPVEPHPPGYFIKQTILDAHGLTQDELAQRLGVTRRTVNELVRNRRSLTVDMALRLAKLTGQSADHWLTLQMIYDIWHAKRDADHPEIAPL